MIENLTQFEQSVLDSVLPLVIEELAPSEDRLKMCVLAEMLLEQAAHNGQLQDVGNGPYFILQDPRGSMAISAKGSYRSINMSVPLTAGRDSPSFYCMDFKIEGGLPTEVRDYFAQCDKPGETFAKNTATDAIDLLKQFSGKAAELFDWTEVDQRCAKLAPQLQDLTTARLPQIRAEYLARIRPAKV